MESLVTSDKSPSLLPRRKLGRTGYDVTVYGVGGWLGVLDNAQSTQAERELAAIQAVRRAVDLGINYFDTSPSYGPAERHLGLGLKELTPAERAGSHKTKMAQQHGENLKQAMDTLRAHKLRSCLTVFGVVLGAPTLRLRPDYLAMVTVGFGEIARLSFLNLDPITGGPAGITGIPRPDLGFFKVENAAQFFRE